jgi:branched-chain amino acid transport system permease protein
MNVPLNIYFIQALHGIVYGMLLFLVSSGLTVIFGMMRILNMAHSAMYMLGAYFGYSLVTLTGNFWLSLVAAPVFVGMVGVILQRFFLRKVQAFGHGHELLLTFGFFMVAIEVVKWFWGNSPLSVEVPPALSGSIATLGFTYPLYRLFIILVGAMILAIMAAIILKTRIGIQIRASVSDSQMVDALGTNVRLVYLGVFAFGSALAGFAGVIAAPFLSPYPGMGFDIMTDTFVVVVVGGFGSLLGAIVASLMIGLIQSFGVLFLPDLALVFQFLLMAVVLVLKPSGLFGIK